MGVKLNHFWRKLNVFLSFSILSGYWEGNEKRSWWSHCSSQSMKLDWLLISIVPFCWFLIGMLLSFMIIYCSLTFLLFYFVMFPGKPNARSLWTLHKCVCERLWSRGNISCSDTHSLTRIILYYNHCGQQIADRFLVETAAFGWVSNAYHYICDRLLSLISLFKLLVAYIFGYTILKR